MSDCNLDHLADAALHCDAYSDDDNEDELDEAIQTRMVNRWKPRSVYGYMKAIGQFFRLASSSLSAELQGNVGSWE